MQRSYTITIALILIAALSVTSLSRSDTADTSNTQTGQITAMPIAIDDTEQAPLRLESAFVDVRQTIFVNGIPGQYFPFQKAVLRNVSKKNIVGFTAFLVNQRDKNIERLQSQPLQLKPQEQFTLIQGSLLISGEIGDYKIMIVSVTFADGEKWMTKPQSPSNWELIAETNEFPRNCSLASKQMSGIAVNCRGTILGYLNQPVGNRFCQKTTNTLVKSTDNGKTWIDITNNIPDVLNIPDTRLNWSIKYSYLVINQVIADGNNFYILIGGTNWSATTLIESNDEGKTWNVVIPKEKTGQYLRGVDIVDGDIIEKSTIRHFVTTNIIGYSIRRWDRKQNKWYEIEKKEDGSGTHEGGTIYKLNSSGQMVETKQLNYDAFDGILSESSDKGKTWTEKYRNLRVVREPGRLDYKTDDEISFDKGKTWRKNSITKTEEYCKGKTLGQGELDEKKGVWLTGNDGKTWEFLFADDGIPVQINSHIDSTGKIYSLHEGKIYRSKSSLPCSNCGKGNGTVDTLANLPTPFTDTIKYGTTAYYDFRHNDYIKRNPQKSPPVYYLSFGKKNLNKFMTELYPNVSPEGKAFLTRVAIILQTKIEDRLKINPKAFAELEDDSSAFQKFAYETHHPAYCEAGWGNLLSPDQRKIVWAIDWTRDLLNKNGIQVGLRLLNCSK